VKSTMAITIQTATFENQELFKENSRYKE